jgi:hypothetical protein
MTCNAQDGGGSFKDRKPIGDHQFFNAFHLETCFEPRGGLALFGISTSKNAPKPLVLNAFDLEMCFAPQRRALFRHLNVQISSDFNTFHVDMCFAAQRALFRTQLPKVVLKG